MNDSDVIHIPLAIAVAVVSVAAVLLISLAITVVFFDKAGYLRRLNRPRALSRVSANGSGRRPVRRPASPRPKEPWGKQR